MTLPPLPHLPFRFCVAPPRRGGESFTSYHSKNTKRREGPGAAVGSSFLRRFLVALQSFFVFSKSVPSQEAAIWSIASHTLLRGPTLVHTRIPSLPPHPHPHTHTPRHRAPLVPQGHNLSRLTHATRAGDLLREKGTRAVLSRPPANTRAFPSPLPHSPFPPRAVDSLDRFFVPSFAHLQSPRRSDQGLLPFVSFVGGLKPLFDCCSFLSVPLSFDLILFLSLSFTNEESGVGLERPASAYT